MSPKHLAFTTNGFGTVLTVVIDLHLMLLANFLLRLMVNELIDDGNELVDKTIAAGHDGHSFDLLPAVGTLGLELQALPDARLAVQFGAVGAHHGVVHMAEAHVASQQILELVTAIFCRGCDRGLGGVNWLCLLVGQMVH